mmetsp:Transcript_13975/g.24294  ORF Transcript_13975/g.24294 Transcript_13975/m.24294 type:complete len:133 (-) Transcript_13975:8-406(-)
MIGCVSSLVEYHWKARENGLVEPPPELDELDDREEKELPQPLPLPLPLVEDFFQRPLVPAERRRQAKNRIVVNVVVCVAARILMVFQTGWLSTTGEYCTVLRVGWFCSFFFGVSVSSSFLHSFVFMMMIDDI